MAVLRFILARLRAYWRILSGVLSYPLLAIIWAEQFAQTARNLLPRFNSPLAKTLGTAWGPRTCPECDFSAFWPAGRLARMGDYSAIYDPGQFEAYRQTVFFALIGPLNWYYPPPSLLVVIPFSYLPFGIGFYVWTMCLALAAVLMLRLARLQWLLIFVSLLSPAALWNFELGQFGVLMGAALICVLLTAAETPMRSGSLVGLLTLKPQFGLLVPFAFLASRNLGAFVAAAAASLLLIGLTTITFGWTVWRSYLIDGLTVSHMILDAAPTAASNEKFGVSVFWMLRSFGAAVDLANVLQCVSALVAVWVTVTFWRYQRLDRFERMALVVFLSLLATPYGYVDDMVAYSTALAVLAWRRQWRIDLLDVLFWTWPTLCPLVYGRTGLVLTPVIVCAALARLWGRAAGLRLALLSDCATPARQMTS